MGTKGAIEGVHINSLSVLSRLNLERAFFSPGTKQTVPNNGFFELSGCL